MNTGHRAHLITRAEAGDLSYVYGPTWHAPLPEGFAPGMVVKIGLRCESGNTEWPWAAVRRVLGGRVWVKVQKAFFDEEHGISAGTELQVRPEEIHLAWTREKADHEAGAQAMRAQEAERQQLASASELFRRVDRHLALDTLPTRRELEQWAERLEVIAEFLEPNPNDLHPAIEEDK